MARIRHTGFKRKRAGLGKRAFKRRRITRRGRNATSYSGARGNATSVPYKSRRLNPRAFQRILYRDTQAMQHYRSVGAGSGSISTPVGSNTMTISLLQAMDNGVASFWSTGGGVLAPDASAAIPLFRGDITVRGGMVGLRLYGDGAYPSQLMIYLVKNCPRPDSSIVTSPQPVGWDPTTVPDFTRDFGRVIFSRRMILEPLGMISVERRIWPMKIDQQSWGVDAQRLTWLIAVADGDTSGQDNIRCVPYFNLSFSADAIGTT